MPGCSIGGDVNAALGAVSTAWTCWKLWLFPSSERSASTQDTDPVQLLDSTDRGQSISCDRGTVRATNVAQAIGQSIDVEDLL